MASKLPLTNRTSRMVVAPKWLNQLISRKDQRRNLHLKAHSNVVAYLSYNNNQVLHFTALAHCKTVSSEKASKDTDPTNCTSTSTQAESVQPTQSVKHKTWRKYAMTRSAKESETVLTRIFQTPISSNDLAADTYNWSRKFWTIVDKFLNMLALPWVEVILQVIASAFLEISQTSQARLLHARR